jgi:hypothetical protein
VADVADVALFPVPRLTRARVRVNQEIRRIRHIRHTVARPESSPRRALPPRYHQLLQEHPRMDGMNDPPELSFGEWLRRRAAESGIRVPLQEHSGGSTAAATADASVAGDDGRLPPGTVPNHPALRPWRKGVSGNPSGRPKETRDRLSTDFIAKLAADFEEHGADAIRRARAADPVAYLGLVARLVPKDMRVANDTGHSSILARLGPAELVELRRQLEEALALARAGHPLVLPPILDAKPSDDGDDG